MPSSAPNDVTALRERLFDAHLEIRRLNLVVADQAKALAALTDDCPPWAPSIAIVYWLYSDVRRADRSWKEIHNRIRPLVDELGSLPAPKLTPLAWERHRAGRRLKGLAEHTLNVELWRAKEMLNWAVGSGMLKYSPLVSAKAVPAVSRRETWLPLADVDRLLAAAPLVKDGRRPRRDDGHRARILVAFVLAAHDSMMRFNEARGLRWDRISEDGRVELAASETKGAKRRVIFLTPRTLRAFSAIPRSSDYVFSTVEGERIPETTLRLWFRRLCREAGVDSLVAPGERQVRPHDLRASGASTADEQGARATAIRDTLGHAALSTTAVYLRSGQADNARSVALVMKAATRKGPQRSVHKNAIGSKQSLDRRGRTGAQP